MTATLRHLLIQRAARLQGRPALTTPEWGTLSWAAWRNRVEGVAMGLLATPLPMGTPVHTLDPGPWAWAAEVAGACCGLVWVKDGKVVPPSILGGSDFNSEEGRGPYHDREHELLPETPFTEGLTHQDLLVRLQAWNRRLGWDHDCTVTIASDQTKTLEGRAALWCALYAGAHTQFSSPTPSKKGTWPWSPAKSAPTLDLDVFKSFYSE